MDDGNHEEKSKRTAAKDGNCWVGDELLRGRFVCVACVGLLSSRPLCSFLTFPFFVILFSRPCVCKVCHFVRDEGSSRLVEAAASCSLARGELLALSTNDKNNYLIVTKEQRV